MASLVIVICTFMPGAAGFGWNDFTNNLATDLAPIITLFGEQVTKQYLSESLSIWDNIIFAMAPMGLLTAVVSAIRVCGSPSLKAFIGRAQESPGTAEIELLSCTSDTTGELWNDGGIARVFGKPQILEIVRLANPKPADYEGSAGIFLFAEGVGKAWEQVSGNSDSLERAEHRSPNLSLNIGIKKPPRLLLYGIAALGSCLQVGVLVFAGLTAYRFPNRFLRDGAPAEQYSFPMMMTGTLLVCLGMFLCAYIIERSTSEVHYDRIQRVKSSLYWIQPGGQKIGDQVFGSFLAVGEGPKFDRYITSSRVNTTASYQAAMLWGGVISTTVGFIVQFLGLRAMHSSVILVQLGSTLIMAIARAGLRAQRIKSEANMLKGVCDIQGHELDYLAMEFEDVEYIVVGLGTGEFSKVRPDVVLSKSVRAIKARIRLARLTSVNAGIDWSDLAIRVIALQLKTAIERVMEVLALDWENGQPERVNYFWTISLRSGSSPERSTLCLRLRKGRNALWMADAAELEAVIGIWTWTLMGIKAQHLIHMNNVQHVRGIVMDPGTAMTFYDSWIQRAVEPDSRLAPRSDEDRAPRFLYFGMHARQAIESGSPTDGLWFPSDHPIPVLCAQDIFTALVSCALSKVHRLGGITELRRQASDENPFIFENERLEEIAAIVEASGLGTRSDAYLCLVPLLEQASKMPSIDVLRDGLQAADRQQGLFWASDIGYESAVSLLLQGGAGVNLSNDEGLLPLHLAARKGHTSVLKALLENGASVYQLASGRRTALYMAAEYGFQEAVSYLLAHGADKGRSYREGLTVLHVAARGGHLEVARLLLEAGVDIEQQDVRGGRALTWAISSKSSAVVGLLLAEGATVDFSFQSQPVTCTYTPLQWAIIQESIDVVKLLLASRQFPTPDREMSLALCRALGRSDIAELIEALPRAAPSAKVEQTQE
ncbi:hypothetical protein BJY00DRAFT_314953 [Aspergillus carlsbadensis]|nr:hypothetical protein BJY00DRAFT_314953 [Aspergillus carlsbadensis]